MTSTLLRYVLFPKPDIMTYLVKEVLQMRLTAVDFRLFSILLEGIWILPDG